MERKLATILSADVVGYSRLVADDEEATLETLNAYRETIGGLISEHDGRVFGQAGDSFVAEFASPVQAVRAAVAIQRALKRHNDDLPDTRKMVFRIGVNLGDIVVDGLDLLGDGVNVAARLQEIAAPSGICISGSVKEQLEGKLTFPIAHLGERQLKNIHRPVQVYRVDWTLQDPAASGVLGEVLALPDRPSIAVLPFVNMSADADQEYFADGITEDIITALSQYRWFFVIARNSTFTYKGRAVDIKQVARELGVRYVLEGSVRKAGNRVRVTGQLIDAETGNHLWAQRYDKQLEDLFSIQDELTQQVVSAIEPEILIGEGNRALSKRTENLDAYDCTMRGMWHLHHFAGEHFKEAVKWERRAVELDPQFVRAHMALARAIYARAHFEFIEDIERERIEIRKAAERALALDDRDPYSHYAMCLAHLLAQRPRAALAEAQRTVDLSPNFALGHLALGWTRILVGNFAEAIKPLQVAMRLSPHDPLSFMFLARIGFAHYHLENYEEAVHFATESRSKHRHYSASHLLLIASLGQLERTEEYLPLVSDLDEETISDFERHLLISEVYEKAEHRDHVIDGLRKAGVRGWVDRF